MKQIHMIGNAHIDPVWLWRYPEGLAEIKATFRSALDRIRDYPDFVFTSACASYYQWVEENCPELFAEIQTAVHNGRWNIVGGMWVQPDCNIPSGESIARHLLQSQSYFRDRFGITAKTGYNVDSFGHSAGFPRLLTQGGIENYIYMRPSAGSEMTYPFDDSLFLWSCGNESLPTFHLSLPYCDRIDSGEKAAQIDRYADKTSEEATMYFYGVGNHGGGPTVTTLDTVNAYRTKSPNRIRYSCPDRYFTEVRENGIGNLPHYEGELQNHASGCYSANSAVKKYNRTAESRLNEAEKLSVMADKAVGFVYPLADADKAWQSLLFNQFHDILAGCAVKAAYDDAYAEIGSAIAFAKRTANAAAQKISWNIDTMKDAPRSKSHFAVWEANQMGTPVVVVNPLSHAAKVPVYVHLNRCASVTDKDGNPIRCQSVRADYRNGGDRTFVFFQPEIPPLGWKTFWVYGERCEKPLAPSPLSCGEDFIANDTTCVRFGNDGNVVSMTINGKELLGSKGIRNICIDDSKNDTWAHNRFVFTDTVGEFTGGQKTVIECGDCMVSMKVTQTYRNSSLTQTYTLYRDDSSLHVSSKLFLADSLLMVKLSVDTADGNGEKKLIREVPGDILTVTPTERELPMQRFAAYHGVALMNDCKYSVSVKENELRMAVARSCYYADHFGRSDGQPTDELSVQDIGETEYRWQLTAFDGNTTPIYQAAEELNTVFPTVTETYHSGKLSQDFTNVSDSLADNIAVTVVKPAQSGKGIVVRLTETAGKATDCDVSLFGLKFHLSIEAYGIVSKKINGNAVTDCDFLE